MLPVCRSDFDLAPAAGWLVGHPGFDPPLDVQPPTTTRSRTLWRGPDPGRTGSRARLSPERPPHPTSPRRPRAHAGAPHDPGGDGHLVDEGDAEDGGEGGSTLPEPVAILVEGAAPHYNSIEGRACRPYCGGAIS
jgi:hypothetical protein